MACMEWSTLLQWPCHAGDLLFDPGLERHDAIFPAPIARSTKGKNTLKIEDITAFLDFLQPRLAKEVWLGFYGGEPLLSWPLIEKTVAYAEKKSKNKFRFTLTTNGSLLKKEHILFFKKNRFKLVLSYDGLAQKNRDAGSVAAVEKALADLRALYPDGYAVNSVFTPQTVPLLAASMAEMLKQGHERLQYALDMSAPWQNADLAALEDRARAAGDASAWGIGKKPGACPWKTSRNPATKGYSPVLPAATAWPCSPTAPSGAARCSTPAGARSRQHPDYAKYCFGALEDFISGCRKRFAGRHRPLRRAAPGLFFQCKKRVVQPVRRPGKLRRLPGDGRPGDRYPWPFSRAGPAK